MTAGREQDARETLRARILQDEADGVDPERRPHPDIKAAWIAGVDTALDAAFAALLPSPPATTTGDLLKQAAETLPDVVDGVLLPYWVRPLLREWAERWPVEDAAASPPATTGAGDDAARAWALPLHRTEAGYPRCATCDGGGCPDCTDPS